MLSITVICIVAFDLMDVIIPSVLLPFAYYVFHVVPINIAYSPFTTETFWMILGAFVLTNALEECGILMRIAYWIIKTCGGTYNRTLYALYLVGLVLGIRAANSSCPAANSILRRNTESWARCRLLKRKPLCCSLS